MPTALLDFSFAELDATSVDGTTLIRFTDSSKSAGPGTTPVGSYPGAVDLGTTGRAHLDIGALRPTRDQFSVRVVFRLKSQLTGRQNLVESTLVPFSLYLVPREGTGEADVVAAVSPSEHGWRSTSTRFGTPLVVGAWYVVDLIYDLDTLAIAVGGAVVSVHAFPHGTLDSSTGNELFVGTWVDGARDHFDGEIAALTWHNGIPTGLLQQVDEWRHRPQWFMTFKAEELRPTFDVGEPSYSIAWDAASGSFIQQYDGATLMFADALGAAFEIHGAIRDSYFAMSGREQLGRLVSDEVATARAGGHKSVFDSGAMYWSSSTGAVAVLDQIYLQYEALGESNAVGFPMAEAIPITGGLEQVFQGARLYYKLGAARAHEVHGAILVKFLMSGGTPAWGFPVSDETDTHRGADVIGTFSTFEGCTIHWSAATGAHEVHGDIAHKYQQLMGPVGELGFPTTDETDVPGDGGVRYNAFENGIVEWFGTYESTLVVRPFSLRIGRVDTSDAAGDAGNDVYLRIQVKDGATVVYSSRRPSTGDWGDCNVVDVDFDLPVLLTPHVTRAIEFSIDVHDAAGSAADRRLGTWTHVLDAANAWGLTDNLGILESGPIAGINSIQVSVKPQTETNVLTSRQLFWGVKNTATDDLSYRQFASAFFDVDRDANGDTVPADPTEALEHAFFDLVVRDIAENGNCFGMSLEAINARKGASVFPLPLDRFTSWEAIRDEINIKHAYQVGAGPIWWFLKEFAAGGTHDPVGVFTNSQRSYESGNDPVLCIAQNYDFSGAPHVVLPIRWNTSITPWQITVMDPNDPGTERVMAVDPEANTFTYDGPGDHYEGAQFSGGRLHYMPFSLLNSRGRTPVADAILLLIAGTIVIMGADSSTERIVDGEGKDLNGFGARAAAELRSGSDMSDFFVGAPSYFGQIAAAETRDSAVRGRYPLAHHVLVRARRVATGGKLRDGRGGGAPALDLAQLTHTSLSDHPSTPDLKRLRDVVGHEIRAGRLSAHRSILHLAHDDDALEVLSPAARKLITGFLQSQGGDDFSHLTRHIADGAFVYVVKHGLSQVRIDATAAEGERTEVTVSRMGTSANTIRVNVETAKTMRVDLFSKLGVSGDFVHLTLRDVPVLVESPLELNLGPGLGGIDVVNSAPESTLSVDVDGILEGRKVGGEFAIPLNGGVRVNLSALLSEGTLRVSRIDNLFGPLRDVSFIPPA